MLVRTDVVDEQQITILRTALEAVQHLSLLWRHEAKSAIEADGDYTPEIVDRILHTWTELRCAAEGGTIRYEGGAGKGDRLGIAAVLADVQWATDVTLYRWRHWRAVQRIYRIQGRPLDWPTHITPLVRLRLQGVLLKPEPPAPFGYQACCEHIATQLGWQGYQEHA